VAPWQHFRVGKTLKSLGDETLITNYEKQVVIFVLPSLIRVTRKRDAKAVRPPFSACLPTYQVYCVVNLWYFSELIQIFGFVLVFSSRHSVLINKYVTLAYLKAFQFVFPFSLNKSHLLSCIGSMPCVRRLVDVLVSKRRGFDSRALRGGFVAN